MIELDPSQLPCFVPMAKGENEVASARQASGVTLPHPLPPPFQLQYLVTKIQQLFRLTNQSLSYVEYPSVYVFGENRNYSVIFHSGKQY